MAKDIIAVETTSMSLILWNNNGCTGLWKKLDQSNTLTILDEHLMPGKNKGISWVFDKLRLLSFDIGVGRFELGDSTYHDFGVKIKAFFGFLGFGNFSAVLNKTFLISGEKQVIFRVFYNSSGHVIFFCQIYRGRLF